MGNANEAVVRKGYKAFSEGDTETLASLFAADAVHSSPGSTQISGDFKGPDEILAYYGTLFELTGGSMRVDLQSATPEGDDVVVAEHVNTAERNGKKLNANETLTFTITDGKIARIVEAHGDPAAWDTFWA